MSETLPEALQAATISCSGLEVRIDCNDHDTKEAIFAGLEALASRSSPEWQPIDREKLARIIDSVAFLEGLPDNTIVRGARDVARSKADRIIALVRTPEQKASI